MRTLLHPAALIGGLLLFSTYLRAADPPPAKGLVVHEWGVWRVHNDVELANADMRAIWDGLPKFVYGQVSGRNLPRHWQNLEPVDRPVLFFHTPAALALEVRIDFPSGLPAVWWPGTTEPAVRDGRIVGRQREDAPFRHLQWNLNVKQAPPTRRGRELVLERIDDKHWVTTLRKVKADDVFAQVGESRFGCERERFLYYDGLLPRGDWVTLSFDKERIRLSSKAKHPLFDVTMIDRRTTGKARVARLAKLDAGTNEKELEFKEIDRAALAKEGPDTLLRQLEDAGLFKDEAGALVDLWRTELFESAGLTLFYRLPQEEFERLLPLTLKPRAEKLVRVGLVVHPYCEPDLAKRVEELVKQLNDDSYEKREAAQKRLAEMGRAAYSHLVRLRKTVEEAEVRARLDRLLATIEVEGTIKK